MWCILISGGGQDRWCTGLLRLKLSDKKTAQVGMLRGCPRSRRSVTAHPRATNLTLNKATRQVQNDGTLFSARQSDQLAFRFAMLPYTPDSTELVTTKNLRRCSQTANQHLQFLPPLRATGSVSASTDTRAFVRSSESSHSIVAPPTASSRVMAVKRLPASAPSSISPIMTPAVG